MRECDLKVDNINIHMSYHSSIIIRQSTMLTRKRRAQTPNNHLLCFQHPPPTLSNTCNTKQLSATARSNVLPQLHERSHSQPPILPDPSNDLTGPRIPHRLQLMDRPSMTMSHTTTGFRQAGNSDAFQQNIPTLSLGNILKEEEEHEESHPDTPSLMLEDDRHTQRD